MNLNERFNILAQAIELGQKGGILTLDDAVKAKQSIDTISKGEKLKESFDVLIKMCEDIQKKGIYSLHDAHVIFVSIDGIDKEIENFMNPTTNEQPKVDETISEQSDEYTWEDTDSSETTKKSSKKKK